MGESEKEKAWLAAECLRRDGHASVINQCEINGAGLGPRGGTETPDLHEQCQRRQRHNAFHQGNERTIATRGFDRAYDILQAHGAP